MEAYLVVGAMILVAAIFSALRDRSGSPKTPKSKGDNGRAVYTKNKTPAQRLAEREMNSGSDFQNVRGTSLFDDEDGLATFNISYGEVAQEKPSTNQTPGRWVQPGEEVRVQGHVITGGFFYFGGKLRAVDRFGFESALIDDSLDVVQRGCTYSDGTLNYWPKYLSLSPKCRGAFLDWMASERNNPETPLGYVFLYFYGLERRIIHDSKTKGAVTDVEFSSIVDEVRRLLSVYGDKPPFGSYAFRLLEWMKLLRPNLVRITNEEISDHNLRVLFSILAGKLVRDGQKIPPEMAYIWLSFTNYSPRTPARRCPKEFKKLFCHLYNEKYGDGMTVKPNKTMVTPSYQPASSSLPHLNLKATTVPNPLVLGSVSGKLMYLANTATQKLDPYSRYLGKEGTSEKDIEAIMLLPDELSGGTTGENLFPEFTQWAADVIDQRHGVADFSEFWSHLNDEPLEKLNKKQIELIQTVLDKTGFGMAPDPRFHHVKPSPEGKVVLFHGGHGHMKAPSKTFNEVGMSLRLGSMVANIDGHVHDSEVEVLRGLIDNNENLSATAKHSLHAYLTWRMNSPQNNVSLKKQIETLSETAKHQISKLMISVALADGKISPDEIKQMEKLYTSLGLDKTMVTSDIHGLTTSGAVKSPASTAPGKKETGFQLDDSVLAHHESETKDVQGILGSIFAENVDDSEDEDDDEQVQTETSSVDEDDGLDAPHRKLMETLMTQEKWSREEYEGLCDKLGLMADGALETINDWSFEQVDAPLLEDEDDIYVMLDIAEEIANQ